MEVVSNKNYENDFYEMQKYRSRPMSGILIYEDAQKKLDISEDGKLYRQKFYNYLPIVGPICATVYANFVLAKTKCLRRSDMILFKGINKSVNWFAFLFWPLLILMLWTLLTYLTVDFAGEQVSNITFLNLRPMNISIGHQGDYNNLWNQALVGQLSNFSINNAQDFFSYLGVMFSGLFFIFFFPLISTGGFIISNAFVNTNLIFILSIMIITIINPVNICNTILINMSKVRFIIVYEASSVYKYRSR